MANSVGYFKVWRELFEKPIWKQSTTAQKSILMAILYLANWKENKWEWCGVPYTCSEGEFISSHNRIKDTAGKGVTVDHIRTALKRFQKLGFITIKSPKNKRGGIKIIINNWGVYQKEENQTKPEQIPIKSLLNPEQIPPIEEDKNIRNKESNIIGKKNSNFQVPTVEEIQEYCISRNSTVNAQKFYDYYNSIGWVVGKHKMKDWKSAIRTWENNEKQFSKPKDNELSCLTGAEFTSKYEQYSEG